jgi:ABC-2 type transport system ATP-binding protein
MLEGISGIEKVNDFGNMQEIRIIQGANHQLILAEIMSKTRVNKFEIASPSLQDIFIRIARPEKNESHE